VSLDYLLTGFFNPAALQSSILLYIIHLNHDMIECHVVSCVAVRSIGSIIRSINQKRIYIASETEDHRRQDRLTNSIYSCLSHE